MRGGDHCSQPAVLRALRGSRVRPRHRAKREPKATHGMPRPPRELTAEELKLWRYYAPRLAKMQVLAEEDREALALFVEARAQILEIKRQQADPAYRRVLISTMIDAAGNERVRAETSPLDVQRRAWVQAARLCGAELGLSPMSRARVGTSKRQEDEDPFATFGTSVSA